MSTITVLSIVFAVMGFIVSNLLVYKEFGSLDFWDIVLFGTLGGSAGVLIGIFVVMVVWSIVF